MKHLPLTVALFSFFLAACGGNPAAGTYVLDTEAMKKAILGSAGTPEERKMAEGIADMALGKMKFELTLKGDGTFTMNGEMAAPMGGKMGEPMTATGTYQVTGNEIKFVTREQDGKPKTPPEEMTGTIKDGVITMAGSAGNMTLRKK
jgi:hypothetical protein